MEKIKTAISKADAQPVLAPIAEPFLEYRPVKHDLLFGRERSGRENTATQFGERSRRRTALADHDSGRGVRSTYSKFIRRFHCQQHSHHRRDRVPGAGDVAYLDRIRGN